MKNGLVLSGGGAKGAFQVGALKWAIQFRPWSEGFEFISGTSVGSINAYGLAMHPPEHIEQAVWQLEDLWHELKKTRNVWRYIFPPYLSALWNPGVGTQAPLLSFLRERLDIEAVRDSGVTLRLPAVDLVTGELKVFTEKSDPFLAMDSSASFPGVFQPVADGEALYTDGGIRDIAPLGEAIKAGCDRILVVLTINPYKMEQKPAEEFKSVLSLAKRVIEIMSNEILLADIQAVRRVNDEVMAGRAPNKRYIDLKIIYPADSLGDPLDFTHEKNLETIETGFNRAKAFIAQ